MRLKYRMTDKRFARILPFFGDEGMERLNSAKVIVFGIGGVGSYCAEALVRSGVGELWFVDGDVVTVTNLNRQLVALESTVGQYKAEVMQKRAYDINPGCKAVAVNKFYSQDNKNDIDLSAFDYVADCIDSVASKITLVEESDRVNVPIISSMGAGNKLDPMGFEVADIYKTSVCPLARVMRRELKKRNVASLKVVYSKELPVLSGLNEDGERRPVPASTAFTPSAAGILMAREIILDIAQNRR